MLKRTFVVVSGGFDPYHHGHGRLFRDAKKLGDKLIVILNNDNWLLNKKGYVFMKQNERKEILESIKYVDKVIITRHTKNTRDKSVTRELKTLYNRLGDKNELIFANGGDRVLDNTPEESLCNKLGIKTVYNVGGKKIESSSELVKNGKFKINS